MLTRYIYIVLGLIIVAALIFGGFLYFQYQQLALNGTGTNQSPTTSTATGTPQFVANTSTPTDTAITQAYNETDQVVATGGDSLTSALQTFVNIAANVNNTNAQRAEALNGINYAYTQSDFDADTVRNIVFSQPPFSSYYVAPTTASTDALHPDSGPEVAAVEAALVKLNELSNSLVPNHYALSRMEVATIFAYQRAAVGVSASQRKTLALQYAKQIEPLIAAYNALPPLDSSTYYPLSIRIQITFVQGTVLAFVGGVENNSADLSGGEALFQQAIATGDAYPTTSPGANEVLNKTLLARIFYATSYWYEYQKTNPQQMESVLLPLTDVSAVQNTTVYKTYLPGNKNTTVTPFSTLRVIAQQMPALKTFLQGEGWTF